MIKIIVGSRGSGKTKTLIDQINEAAKTSAGNVICLDKTLKLQYELATNVRLVDIDQYGIKGFGEFLGFVCGLMAGNYDITHIFVDSILKVGGAEKDLDGLGVMLGEIDELKDAKDIEFVFTVSAEEAALPESVRKYL